MTRVPFHPAPIVFLLLVAGGPACKPKECDAVVTASDKVRAALSEIDLAAAKGGVEAVVAAAAPSENPEIRSLSQTATMLADSVTRLERTDLERDHFDGIAADLERHQSAFLDAHREVLYLCR